MLGENPEMLMCVPPSPGISTAWSGSPNLGSLCDYEPDVNGNQTILKLDEWGYPEVWTLTLTLDHGEYEDFPGTSVGAEITAVVTYGTGGASHTIEMDWNDGARISLPMDSIQVNAKYNLTTDAFGQIIPPPDLRLGAQIARGACKSTARLTRRIRYLPSNVGDSTIAIGEVPTMASEFSLFNTNINYTALGGITCTVLSWRFGMSDLTRWGSISRTMRGAEVVQHTRYELLGGERYMDLYVDVAGAPWVGSTQYVGIIYYLGT